MKKRRLCLRKTLISEKHEIKERIQSEKNIQGKGNPLRKFNVFLPAIVISVTVCIAVILFLNHRTKVRWATEKALPRIEILYEESNYIEAFNLVTKAERYIPDNAVLQDWLPKLVSRLTILTDPHRG